MKKKIIWMVAFFIGRWYHSYSVLKVCPPVSADAGRIQNPVTGPTEQSIRFRSGKQPANYRKMDQQIVEPKRSNASLSYQMIAKQLNANKTKVKRVLKRAGWN